MVQRIFRSLSPVVERSNERVAISTMTANGGSELQGLKQHRANRSPPRLATVVGRFGVIVGLEENVMNREFARRRLCPKNVTLFGHNGLDCATDRSVNASDAGGIVISFSASGGTD
jgi:hypothetical protein